VWLLAWDTVRQLPAYIDLGQIADATDLEQPAAWPDSFTPQEWIRSQFGVSNAPRDLVVLRFSSRTAHEVRHRFWTSQDVWQDFPSGEVELSMQTPANDPALVSWIMGFGDGVSVVGPQSLRKTIAENHRSAWMAYSTERESK
jgi:predicted DNA-binding transcriptional regulator YafY